MRVFFLSIVGLVVLVARAHAEDHALHTFKRVQLTEVFYGEGADFGDLDKDGDMDIVSGPYWYAGPEFSKKHEIYPPKPFNKNGYSDNFFCFVHDINKDGWEDVLVIGFPGAEAPWYENPRGKSGHWPRHVAFNGVDNESPGFTDITGDGEPEIVFHTKGRLGWAGPAADDPTKPWIFHAVSPKLKLQRFSHGLGVGDVNGDGKKDFLLASGWWEHVDGGEWKHHPVTFGFGGAQMYAYDFDGDGDNDVFTALRAHQHGISWFEQVRKDGAIKWVEHPILGAKPADNDYGVFFTQPHALELVDMDGDGIKDIVVGKRYWAHNGNDPDARGPRVVYWLRTTRVDGGVRFIPHLIDDASAVGTQVVVGDVSGNGLNDVVIGNKAGTYVILHETRKVSAEEWERAQPKPFNYGGRNIQKVQSTPADPKKKITGGSGH